MPRTPQQEAIIEAVRDGDTNLTIEALAGSGKTTACVDATTVAKGRCGLVCFNKHIAAELQARLPATVQACTLHSLGFAALRRAFRDPQLDEQKLSKLSRQLKPQMYPSERIAAEQLCRLSKYTLCLENGTDAAEAFDGLADHFGVELPRNPEAVYDLAQQLYARSGDDTRTVDFDDMIWLPRKWGIRPEPFDLLLVDEAQDLNRAQQELALAAVNGGRLAPIGDRHQCHPAGTLVTLTGGDLVPVEDLRPGVLIASFNPNLSCLVGLQTQGRQVEAVANRDYAGKLYDVNGTPCTPNHRWLTRFADSARSKIALYLMELEDGSFRIGQTQLMLAGSNGFGPGLRARGEGALKVWLLDVFDSRAKAREREFKDSIQYLVPQRAQYERASDSWARELIDAGVFPHTAELLAKYGRAYQFPIWEKRDPAHLGKYSFVTQACNLLPDVNLIAKRFGGGREVQWVPLALEITPAWSGRVYSLQVEPTEGGKRLYLANGNVTSNSIYGFSGSDCDALPRLAERLTGSYRGGQSLPLTVCWRCPVSHLALAQQIVPEIEPASNAVDGTIRTMPLAEIRKAVQPEDLVICRKNAPLVGLTYKLVLAGVRAVMRGRDIGKGLLGLIARLKPDTLEDLIRRLADYQHREEQRLIQRDASASAFQALEDRCDCLGQLSAQVDSLEALERFIAETFDDQAKPGPAVVLSSVHRAKGLEADRVFVLDPDSLPLIHRDSKPWERQQERNLVYVAVTRAKKELIFEDHLPKIFGERR